MGRTLVDCQGISALSTVHVSYVASNFCYLQDVCKQAVVDVYNIWHIYIYMLICWHRKSMKSHWFQLFSSLVKQEKSWNFDRNNRCCWSTKFDEQIWTILGLAVEVFLWSLWFSRKNNWFSLIFFLCHVVCLLGPKDHLNWHLENLSNLQREMLQALKARSCFSEQQCFWASSLTSSISDVVFLRGIEAAGFGRFVSTSWTFFWMVLASPTHNCWHLLKRATLWHEGTKNNAENWNFFCNNLARLGRYVKIDMIN